MSQGPYCQRMDQQVKAGHNASGSQRYRCQVCQRQYTPEPKPREYSENTRREALRLYVDGIGFRRIARILGVTHRSVINGVNAHAARLPDLPPVPEGPLEVNELDELFTFVGSKKRRLRSHARRSCQSVYCELDGRPRADPRGPASHAGP